jgi:AcrR family transcriptional regulator
MTDVEKEMVQPPVRTRRTQEERTAHTRMLLINSAIVTISVSGYAGASTAMIAKSAGVSRGAMLHHYPTRAALMADVVRVVFDREMTEYNLSREQTGFGTALHHWPLLLWQVLSQPSGLAVLEILQATRSDPELADLVVPMQEEVEQAALVAIRSGFGGDESLALTVMRLMVWTVRGLSIAERHLPSREETHKAVEMLSALLLMAAPDSRIDSLGNVGEALSGVAITGEMTRRD